MVLDRLITIETAYFGSNMIRWAKNPNKMTESTHTSQRAELSFTEQDQDCAALIAEPGKPGKRKIPIGRKLRIVSQGDSDETGIEATVLKNDDIELAVQLEMPLEISQDEVCSVC